MEDPTPAYGDKPDTEYKDQFVWDADKNEPIEEMDTETEGEMQYFRIIGQQ